MEYIRTNVRIVPFVKTDNGLKPCSECYFYGFVDNMPENNHTCPDCRIAGEVPRVEMSFEEWKENQEFADHTFFQFFRDVTIGARLKSIRRRGRRYGPQIA